MRVRATATHRVPMEHDPHKHITAATPLDVPDSLYYRRRLASGELERVASAAAAPAPAPAPTPAPVDDAASITTPRKKGSHA